MFSNLNTKEISDNFDYDRQIKFNNALYKFGFAKYGGLKLLSEEFKVRGQQNLLPYCQHYAHGETRHYHHLHLQGLSLSKILQVKAKQ